MFQFLAENWRKWRHFLKNTARIEIIITISTQIRTKKNKSFGPCIRAVFHTYSYYNFNGRFHTRGRTNRLDGQIVWHLFVWCEFEKAICRKVVRLKFALPEEYEHKSVHLSAKRTGTRFKLCCKSKSSSLSSARIFPNTFSFELFFNAIVSSTRAQGLSLSSFDASNTIQYNNFANVVYNSSSSDHVLFFFEHFALFFADFADFFFSSAMLKLPIKPRSVASPISSRRENQPFDRLMWI